jgi:hypothetical protein
MNIQTDEERLNDNGVHEIECEEQPEGFPCICDHLKEMAFIRDQEGKEAEITGN